MKKNLKIFYILALSFLMTGCYSLNAKMNIKDNKSMEFTMLHAINEVAYENYIKEQENPKTINQILEIEKINKNLIPRGYTVDEYNSAGKKGVIISKSFDSIDEISKEGDEVRVTLSNLAEDDFNDKLFFTVKKGLLYNTYTATFIFDLNNEFDQEGTLEYEVILPVESIDNNSTNVSSDGKSLTWKIKSNGITEVNYSFKMAEKTDLYFAYGSVALIILLILIGIGTAIGNNKRKKARIKKIPESIKEEKVEIKNNGVDLMKEQSPINAGGIDLMKAPEIGLKTEEITQLHPTTGPAVNIDAPAVIINATAESAEFVNNQVEATNNFNNVFEPTFINNDNGSNNIIQTQEINKVDETKSTYNNLGTIETNQNDIIQPQNTVVEINETKEDISPIEYNQSIVSIPELENDKPVNIDSITPVNEDVYIETNTPKIVAPKDESIIVGIEEQPIIINSNLDNTQNPDNSINNQSTNSIEQEEINQQPIILESQPVEIKNQDQSRFINPDMINEQPEQSADDIMNFNFDLSNQTINTNIEPSKPLEHNQINPINTEQTMNFDFDLSNQSINNETKNN